MVLTESQAVEHIRKLCDDAGSQKALAELYDVEESRLSKILRGRENLSATVAGKFGFEKNEQTFTKTEEVTNG